MTKAITKDEIKIEAGVEIPTLRFDTVYPWYTMEIGESFELEKAKGGGARSSLTSIRKKDPEFNRKFTSRTMENGRVRFWRTE